MGPGLRSKPFDSFQVSYNSDDLPLEVNGLQETGHAPSMYLWQYTGDERWKKRWRRCSWVARREPEEGKGYWMVWCHFCWTHCANEVRVCVWCVSLLCELSEAHVQLRLWMYLLLLLLLLLTANSAIKVPGIAPAFASSCPAAARVMRVNRLALNLTVYMCMRANVQRARYRSEINLPFYQSGEV